MDGAAVERRLARLVAGRMGIDPKDLAPGLLLADDLALDSLDRLELAMAVESAFDVDVPDGAWATIRTWGDLVERVATLVGARARLDEAAAPRVRVTAEILRAGSPCAVVRTGRLTPYCMETIADDLRGRELVGAVDVEVAGADDAAMRTLEHGLRHLRELGMPLRIHRWGTASRIPPVQPPADATEPEERAAVELSLAAGSLLHALQEERATTVAALEAGIEPARERLAAARAGVDGDAEAFSRTMETFRAVPSRAARHAARALEILDRAPALRERAQPGYADPLVHGLTQAADELLGCLGSLEVVASSTRTARAVTAYAALVRAKESAVLEQARLTNALGADALEPIEARAVEALARAERLHLEEFTATASPEARSAYWDLASDPAFTRVARVEHELLQGAGQGPLIDPAVWFALASDKLARLHDLERLQSEGLRAAAAAPGNGWRARAAAPGH